MPNPESLREDVRARAENRPGVYRMRGAGEELLYVGKSVRVRSRLLAYFRAGPGEKAHDVIRETERIEWDYVPDEFGALVREMRLIQTARPRFNVQHKRKRAWGFVKLTREAAPRLLPVRTVAADGARYFGPFPAVGTTARTIRELAQTLGLRDCGTGTPIHFSEQEEIFQVERGAGCLRGDTGSCLAPCAARCSSKEYLARAHTVLDFLLGRSDAPIAILDSAMQAASARLDFEYAAILRDRAYRLSRFREELAAFRGEVEGLSFVYQPESPEGGQRAYLIRHGLVRGEVEAPRTSRARARAADRVAAVFDGVRCGPGGLDAREAAEILLVARWFRLRPEERAHTYPADEWIESVAGAAAGRGAERRRPGGLRASHPLPRSRLRPRVAAG